jgi:hypothetical protein
MEAVTPGQFKSGGAGVKPGCGFHETAFGRALIALSNNGTDPMLISYLISQKNQKISYRDEGDERDGERNFRYHIPDSGKHFPFGL